MKKITILLFSLLALCGTTFATDVTVTTGTDAGGHTVIPIGGNNSALGGAAYNLAAQQIYLASELGGTTNAGNITAISFHYKTGTTYANNRTNLKVYINTTSNTNVDDNKLLEKGTLVYSSSAFNVPASDSWYKLSFSSPYSWDGTSNIIITFVDESNSLMPTSKSHWAYTTTDYRCIVLRKGYDESIPASLAGQAGSFKDKYVANAKFDITLAAASAPATPTGLAVTATTHNSANLSWNTSSGATSYALKYSTDNANWSDISGATALTTNSFSWTGLTSEATYYVKVNATNANGSSDFSDAVSFTTDALHTHDGITFTKWSATDAMPTSGNYYLANNVTITSNFSTGITGALKLCLNGKTLAFTQASAHIEVGGSLEVFDHVGGGQITSAHGTSTIQVNSGASLKLHSGNITNTGGGTALNAAAHTVTYAISESDNNDALISLANGGTVDAVLERSFNSASFNTICAPFDIPSDKIASAFGSGTVIAELTAANVVDDQLELTFDDTKTSITAGKPYLIQPHNSVSNPTFLSVILKSGTTPTELPDIDFIGVVNRKTFAASEENKNLLFLQADNTLYFHDGSGAFINGMRAYFLIKNSSIRMSVNNARIKRSSETTTAIDQVAEQPTNAAKRIENGQLVIIRDGVKYNTTGQIIK